MQRTLLIVVVTALVAAGLAAGTTLLLTDDSGELTLASPSPSASPVATVDVTEPSASPEATAESTDAPTTNAPKQTDQGGSGSGNGGSTKPPTKIRSASSVNCDKEPHFCSASEGMVVKDGKVEARSMPQQVAYPGRPKISMSTDVVEDGNGKVKRIDVDVLVQNDTNKTFTFPRRQIVLDIYVDGKLWKSVSSDGDGFDMTPDGKMTGSFEHPILKDGSYSWETKTWYYEK